MIPFPDKKYSIIYADPPWEYGSRGPRSGRFGELDYNTMSVRQICGMPIREIAQMDCALFIWATSPFLMEAGKVISAWGFKYIRVDSVWKKVKKPKHSGHFWSLTPHGVCGPWGMTDVEFLLMGVMGTMCDKQVSKRNKYTAVEEFYTGKHSEKPHVFRERIELRFGELPRIELFARQIIPGWDVWGNEV